MTGTVKTRNDKGLSESSGHVNGKQRLNQSETEQEGVNVPCQQEQKEKEELTGNEAWCGITCMIMYILP